MTDQTLMPIHSPGRAGGGPPKTDHLVVGRFAPSPTSELHLGNLRTALLAWLFARDVGGEFRLRIEDLDQTRVGSAPGVAAQQLADLSELGLDWDGDVLQQSQRTAVYRAAAAGLETYECFCTRREIAEASQAPNGSPGYRPYPGTCAQLSNAQRRELRTRRPAAIRVRAHGATFTVHDIHVGEVTKTVDDFVLFRSNGTPAYNLAVVVDDAAQGITQVTRGDDLLASAPRQGWLATQLGYRVPSYAHVGLVVNGQGDRLAKRDGAVSLSALHAAQLTTQQVFWLITDALGWPRTPSPASLLQVLHGTPWWRAEAIWEPWVFTAPAPAARTECR